MPTRSRNTKHIWKTQASLFDSADDFPDESASLRIGDFLSAARVAGRNSETKERERKREHFPLNINILLKEISVLLLYGVTRITLAGLILYFLSDKLAAFGVSGYWWLAAGSFSLMLSGGMFALGFSIYSYFTQTRNMNLKDLIKNLATSFGKGAYEVLECGAIIAEVIYTAFASIVARLLFSFNTTNTSEESIAESSNEIDEEVYQHHKDMIHSPIPIIISGATAPQQKQNEESNSSSTHKMKLRSRMHH